MMNVTGIILQKRVKFLNLKIIGLLNYISETNGFVARVLTVEKRKAVKIHGV